MKIVPVLTLVLVVAAFFIGSLYTELRIVKQGKITAAPIDSVLPEKVAKGTASVEDDPVLGDTNAPITIIEFSDYECPFCKRHFDQTLPQLISQYVNSGKVKIVFRDFPLSFHDPMATKEAVAANCAKDQGGDKKYFEFHDEIFKRTISNGNGLNDDKIKQIASDLKLNSGKFTACLSNKATEDEVKKDIADGQAAGASGTPTFVIGKSAADGIIAGELLVGAQPLAAFQALIDPLLQ